MRASTVGILLATALASLGFVALLFSPQCLGDPGRQSFDASVWQAEPPGSEARYRMAKDLVQSKTLIGKTSQQVEQLLGEGHYIRSTGELTYPLGGRTRFGLGNVLVVRMDTAGVVQRAFIYSQ